MKILNYCLLLTILNLVNLEAHMLHQKNRISQEWMEEHLEPFDELIMSWNSARPIEGQFLFYISVKVDQWSPWLLYALWGSEGQSSFTSTTGQAPAKVYQDTLEVAEGKKATAFRLKIVTKGSASLDSIHSLHMYTNSDKLMELQKIIFPLSSIYLQVPGLSQMALKHIRHADLCSPTSTTAIVRYLSNDYTIDPVSFAQQAWDGGFDIFGNWVFNVAQWGLVTLATSWDEDFAVARVTVTDNGVGIPESELDAIFGVFASSKGSRGTGLGLPVSRKVVREHGGKIVVTSQTGKGSTFVVELPLKLQNP